MKIVYSCDWHLRSRVPEYRKEGMDKFRTLQINKINEYIQYLNDNGDIGIIDSFITGFS